MTGRIRDLLDWPPDPSGWVGSSADFEKLKPDLMVARIERAQPTRLGVQLEIRIVDRIFHRSFPLAEQRRLAVAEGLNRARGLDLEAAGDQVVE